MAEGTPTSSPNPSSVSTSRITSQTTDEGFAPNAILTPISLVRRATTNAITPYNLIAARIVARNPKPADNNAINRHDSGDERLHAWNTDDVAFGYQENGGDFIRPKWER